MMTVRTSEVGSIIAQLKCKALKLRAEKHFRRKICSYRQLFCRINLAVTRNLGLGLGVKSISKVPLEMCNLNVLSLQITNLTYKLCQQLQPMEL